MTRMSYCLYWLHRNHESGCTLTLTVRGITVGLRRPPCHLGACTGWCDVACCHWNPHIGTLGRLCPSYRPSSICVFLLPCEQSIFEKSEAGGTRFGSSRSSAGGPILLTQPFLGAPNPYALLLSSGCPLLQLGVASDQNHTQGSFRCQQWCHPYCGETQGMTPARLQHRNPNPVNHELPTKGAFQSAFLRYPRCP